MNAAFILSFGTSVLAFGCVALLLVFLSSPQLRGIRWMSAAFGFGAAAAGLLLPSGLPLLNVLTADLCLLLSFISLHVAVLRLTGQEKIRVWHAGVLLGVQALVDGLKMEGMASPCARIVTISLLVALQSFVTAWVLWRVARRSVRAPAIFNSVLLASFGGFNLFRVGVALFYSQNRKLNAELALFAFALFIAVALGLAFGFFWLTTSSLTQELEHIASTDPLTRLYNRRVFLRWCDRELLRTQRSGMPFSLLMLDLDHFKHVNDRFGHHVGDRVLCAAVETIQDSVRGVDVLCRWGGEEFAVLLPNAAAEATRLVAERIRENMQRLMPFELDPLEQMHDLQLTVSIGTATYRDLDDDVGAMLQRADRALYQAKSTGRNRVLVASET